MKLSQNIFFKNIEKYHYKLIISKNNLSNKLIKRLQSFKKKVNPLNLKLNKTLLLILTTLSFSSNIVLADEAKHKYWAEKIKGGGYILHFRHGHRNRYTTSPRTPETDVTAFDAAMLSLGLLGENEDFGLVTCLTEEGKAESKLIGRVFEILDMKVSDIISSPSCRARETAYYGFGTEGKIVNSLLHRTSWSEDQYDEANKNLREHIFKLKIEPGSNALMFGHVGTLSGYYKKVKILDENQIKTSTSDRDDIGIVVIERKNDKLIGRHIFPHFSKFSKSLIKLPLN